MVAGATSTGGILAVSIGKFRRFLRARALRLFSVIPVVENFLEKPDKKIPFATAGTGYHPGETR
jgi:hypothetical protein